jgi:CTD kinase subunit gamma
MRINLLYFLDSLCEASALAVSNERFRPSSSSTASGPGLFYVHLLQKDLDLIVQCAVPESREGLMNVQSTMQVRPLSLSSISGICRLNMIQGPRKLAYKTNN